MVPLTPLSSALATRRQPRGGGTSAPAILVTRERRRSEAILRREAFLRESNMLSSDGPLSSEGLISTPSSLNVADVTATSSR